MSQVFMEKKFDVSVVGAIGIDTNVYFYTEEIDFDVEANFTENIDYLGQAGGYCSRGYAHLGINTAFVGHVGSDHHGDYIRRILIEEGIDTSCLGIDPKGTKRSVNFMYPDGRRKNFYDGKGHMKLNIDISKIKAIFSDSKFVHFALMNWSRELLPIAKDLDLPIVVDLQDIVDLKDPYRLDFIKQADILFFSTVNFPDPTPIINNIRILNPNPNLQMVVGMGDKGCAYADQKGVKFYPPVEMINHPVIDTNGAGDSLAIGFLSSYLLENYGIEESILRGQIIARYTCGIKANTDLLMYKNQLEEKFHYYNAKK
jgi:sugar/nucleoside kinase (ribokinase family)